MVSSETLWFLVVLRVVSIDSWAVLPWSFGWFIVRASPRSWSGEMMNITPRNVTLHFSPFSSRTTGFYRVLFFKFSSPKPSTRSPPTHSLTHGLLHHVASDLAPQEISHITCAIAWHGHPRKFSSRSGKPGCRSIFSVMVVCLMKVASRVLMLVMVRMIIKRF